jgi:threonine dehydrogenase-like Zn-dependent dehydrogenase
MVRKAACSIRRAARCSDTLTSMGDTVAARQNMSASLEEGRIRLDDISTHRLPLAEAPHGYEIFNEKKEGCVKVVLTP